MPIDLDELERLAKAATPLPWKNEPDENFFDHDCQIIKTDTAFVCEFVTEKNAVYITAACNAVPELIKMYREADDEAADANSAWQKVRRENLALRERVRELEIREVDYIEEREALLCTKNTLERQRDWLAQQVVFFKHKDIGSSQDIAAWIERAEKAAKEAGE